MQIVYCFIIWLYYLAILFASPFNSKASKWIKGRKKIFEKIRGVCNNEHEYVWFHCASLGEFEQGRPVIEEYRKKFPEHKILLTFFSPSGYEIRKNYNVATQILYLPLDTRSNALAFINTFNPVKAFFIKYEIWFNYLKILNEKKIPVYLVSAIFRPGQVFFRWYGKWYLGALNRFTHIFVQNKDSEILLNKHGISNVSISGDTRFDRVAQISQSVQDIPVASAFSTGYKVIIAGSVWPPDEDLLTPYINNSPESVRFIIAPHQISKDILTRLENSLKVKHIRYSKADVNNVIGVKTLIIDNIGLLSSLYRYGCIAYIGGGFGKGIHNILEAAVFGQPVIFGTNYERFSEAVELISLKGAFTVKNKEELDELFNAFLNEPALLEKTSEICRNYVAERTGATNKIFQIYYSNYRDI